MHRFGRRCRYTEEFDLSYYTYGLRIYGNLPLIEPMETKETLQVETFVVVIDTSYSTNGELVKKFLQLTADLLLESVELSGKCKIHILQCDDKVRQDDVVTSKEELAQTLQRFTLTEGGSTDFRPAFRYVDQLMQSGQTPPFARAFVLYGRQGNISGKTTGI